MGQEGKILLHQIVVDRLTCSRSCHSVDSDLISDTINGADQQVNGTKELVYLS